MDTKKVDLLNIGLIFLSLLLAFKMPFELFLFSYGVLGPLHYLTEINWLKKKNYFVQEQKWIWALIVLCVAISIPVLLQLPFLKGAYQNETVQQLAGAVYNVFDEIVLITLIFAVGLVYLKKWQHLLPFLFISVILSVVILKFIPFTIILVGVFLPTIIHIYLFTLLFMIFGTMNSRSTAGIIAIVFLLLSPFIIFALNINPANYQMSEAMSETFMATDLQTANSHIAQMLGASGEFILMSAIGVKIQMFIAFCYTYHYLNWFSKTTVIGWHRNVSKPRLAIIISLWISSVLLYWYDYKTGLSALFFLSMLHIILEFPLNITCIKGIASKLKFGPQTAR